MISVRINGQDSAVRTDGLRSMGELIELIKASIDPDHIITNLLLDGRELDEHEWGANLSTFGTAIIEIETGTPTSFVASRLGIASEIVREISKEFQVARQAFQNGEMHGGNQKLIQAVNTASAFFQWYAAIYELVPDRDRARFDITSMVEEISEVCKRLCQQQLYQSWWALGETISSDLEPRLGSLENFCRQFATAA